MATPRVTAGLICALGLPQAIAVNTPHITAKAHPAVMTSQPEFSALDFLRRTAATTPSPSRMSTRVPMNSPNQGVSIPPFYHKNGVCTSHILGAKLMNRGRRASNEKRGQSLSAGLKVIVIDDERNPSVRGPDVTRVRAFCWDAEDWYAPEDDCCWAPTGFSVAKD